MVGVPHSTGCSRCRERRIKCDKVTPECSQCRRYGRPCPGYQRTFRFQDEGPALERRHLSASNRTRRQSTTSSETSPRAVADKVRENALAMMPRHGFQEEDFGSPTQIRLGREDMQCFADFIRTSFPTMYYHNKFRSTDRLDFPSYVIQKIGSHGFLDAAVACLSSVYLAHLSRKPEDLEVSRQWYDRALQESVRALEMPDPLSDAMLCTMMMLSVYEMYAQTRKDAWVVHANAVRRVMASRGAQAHASGLARSCYIAYRGFLVATAIYQGKPCFLDEEEWQQLALQIGEEDSRKPSKWPRSIYPAELVFIEMAKCPRYLSLALELTEYFPSPLASVTISDLVPGIQSTRQRLIELIADLWTCMNQDEDTRSSPPQDAMTGESCLSLLLRGAENAVVILGDLMGILRRAAGQPLNDRTALSLRVESELDHGPPLGPLNRPDLNAITWLDRVASSMGMLGTAIVSDN